MDELAESQGSLSRALAADRRGVAALRRGEALDLVDELWERSVPLEEDVISAV
jgi:hypothetical protein